MGLFGGGGLFGGSGGLFGSGGGLFDGGGLFGSGGSRSGSSGGSSLLSGGSVISDPHDLGNMPIPESIKEKMRDSDSVILKAIAAADDASQELHEVLSDGKDELHEILTDGVHEMVIKGNQDYKTSFELKEEASERISNARSRYQRKADEVNRQIEALNDHMKENRKKKETLLLQIKGQLPEDKVQKISSYAPSSPTYEKPDTFLFDALGFSVLSIHARKEAAEDYLEEAKDYETEVSRKIAELDVVRSRTEAVEGLLQEESTLLKGLEKSLSISRPESCLELGELLNALLAEYILDQSGNPNSAYQKLLTQLKALCAAL